MGLTKLEKVSHIGYEWPNLVDGSPVKAQGLKVNPLKAKHILEIFKYQYI
jgi:hypothetical protein